MPIIHGRDNYGLESTGHMTNSTHVDMLAYIVYAEWCSNV